MGIRGQHFRPEFINRVDDVVVFGTVGWVCHSAYRLSAVAAAE